MADICWNRKRIKECTGERHYLFLLFAVLLSFLLVFPGSPELSLADDRVPEEYQIKAAFIPNFVRFVTWPHDCAQKSPFVFLVLGDNPFGPSLEPVNRMEFEGCPASVEYRSEWKGELENVRVLFISHSLNENFSSVLNAVKGLPILTVSDINGFAAAGGMIEFTSREGSIHFIINLRAVRDAHLDMNFQLLQLADRVMDK